MPGAYASYLEGFKHSLSLFASLVWLADSGLYTFFTVKFIQKQQSLYRLFRELTCDLRPLEVLLCVCVKLV